ncbi:MAG: DUF1573 domain-containing protein [Planctomycetes bacterium]|nr:DUF1573 domain-containing protein [Planctomycetota bacterium]
MARFLAGVLGMLAILGLGPALASAQDSGWARKLFKDQVVSHDFGSVPHGAQLYYRFELYNPYAVQLEVMNLRASCGCVTPTMNVQVLNPRQKAFLDIYMDARRFTGDKLVSVYFTVGPQFISTATLQISAHSRADVVFNPSQINFGVVPRGETPTQTIDVEYAGVLDWRVTQIDTTGAPFDVALEDLYRRPGQVGYRVKVTLKPDAPGGALKQEIVLKTNDPATPLVPILVEATLQSPLEVVPAIVSLGNPKVGDTVTKKVVVRGSKPFSILAIDGLGDGVAAELPTTPRAVQILTLKYQPGKAGDLHRQLLIRTDLQSEAPAAVTLEGNVVP